MKVLIIGGNGFVGRRLSQALSRDPAIELHVLNRSGKVEGAERVHLHTGNRNELPASGVPDDFDAIVDFVCFTDRQAEEAVDYFRKVGRYLLISSMSVYDGGAGLTEAAFDPHAFDLSTPALRSNPIEAYQDGKRRAEAVLAQRARFPSVLVRFPFILGPDDYTRRLAFHVERVASGKPIYLPEPEARISFVHAGDAAAFLAWALRSGFSGPANVASPDAISLRQLIALVETAVGRSAIRAEQPSNDSASPYGASEDYFVDTSHVTKAGFTVRPLADWLPQLIAETARGTR